MKELRTREEQLEELNRRRRAVGQEADAAERKLNKMGAEVRPHIARLSVALTLA